MYNRYIPQRDGSYRRSPTPEPQPSPPTRPQGQPPRHQGSDRPKPPPVADCPPQPQAMRPPQPRPQPVPSPQGVGSFLKNLLPKNFDTADLLVVLLILLMAGDCQEDQNTALLTLALYFFL